MNGSEREIKGFNTESIRPLSYNTPLELTPEEKMHCVMFSASPFSKTIWKLCEIAIVQARDEAMSVDPSDRALQTSKMTIAHSMHKFYSTIRNKVERAIDAHKADLDEIAMKEALLDQDKMEEIILSQLNQ